MECGIGLCGLKQCGKWNLSHVDIPNVECGVCKCGLWMWITTVWRVDF